jgi:ribosomal protein L40E
MDYRNLGDIVAQLRSAGLDLASVKKGNGGALVGEVYVGSTKSVRCDTSDRPGKQSGAYRLREFQTRDGGWWLGGSYWLDHGSTSFKLDINKECADCGADIPLRAGTCPACGKKKFKSREVSPEEVAAHKKFMEESRRQAEAADKPRGRRHRGA